MDLAVLTPSPYIAKLDAPLDTEFKLLPYMDKVLLKLSQVLSYLADLGTARGSSSNSVVSDLMIKYLSSLIVFFKRSHSSTVRARFLKL